MIAHLKTCVEGNLGRREGSRSPLATFPRASHGTDGSRSVAGPKAGARSWGRALSPQLRGFFDAGSADGATLSGATPAGRRGAAAPSPPSVGDPRMERLADLRRPLRSRPDR